MANDVKKIKIGTEEIEVPKDSLVATAQSVEIDDMRDGQGLAVGESLGSFGKVISIAPMENNENARVIRFEDGHVISTTCASWNASKAYPFANEADGTRFKAWVKNYNSPFKTEKQFLTSTKWKELKVKDIQQFRLVARDGSEYNKNFVMFG